MISMAVIDRAELHHALNTPIYLFSVVQRGKSMDIVMNGRMRIYLVIQVKGR